LAAARGHHEIRARVEAASVANLPTGTVPVTSRPVTIGRTGQGLGPHSGHVPPPTALHPGLQFAIGCAMI
jgi:hypothetical protein